jgi:hypothetical protein
MPGAADAIPSTLQHKAAARFWLALIGTGALSWCGTDGSKVGTEVAYTCEARRPARVWKNC